MLLALYLLFKILTKLQLAFRVKETRFRSMQRRLRVFLFNYFNAQSTISAVEIGNYYVPESARYYEWREAAQ